MRVAAVIVLAGLLGFAPADGAQPEDLPAETFESIVVLWLSSGDRDTHRAAIEAFEAQMGSISAKLVVREAAPEAEVTGRAWIQTASDIAREEGATAVFWIEPSDDGSLVLYTVEGDRSDRALVRRIDDGADGSPGTTSAQLETVAVIARRTTSALLRGAEIGVGFHELRAEPLPVAVPRPVVESEPAPPPKRQRGKFRFGAAYDGSTFAPEQVWLSGLALRVGWRFRFGLLVDAGYTVTQAANGTSDRVDLTVWSHPVELAVGYRHDWRIVGLAAEVAGVLDYATHRTLNAGDSTLENRSDGGRVVFGIAPRVRLSVRPLEMFGLYLGAGLPIHPGAFAYVADLPSRAAILRPWRIRANLRVGVAFFI